MAFFNFRNFIQKKVRTHKSTFNFVTKSADDVVDFGETAYKFDGKRWLKSEDEDEVSITDAVNIDDSTTYASAKAVKTLNDSKANTDLSNVSSPLPAAVVTELKGDVGATFVMDGTTLNITT